MQQIFAVIDEQTPLYQQLIRVFGSRRIPLIDERLVRGDAPGLSDELFFKVDWQRLTEEQIEKWSRWMSECFHLPLDEVLADMKKPEHGIPIRARHVLCLEPEGTKPIYPRGSASLPTAIDARMFH